jgi:hypothetical protein
MDRDSMMTYESDVVRNMFLSDKSIGQGQQWMSTPPMLSEK